jgi:hypothetical protein
MEEILKYASLIALLGTAISFIVGFVKWLDQRNREQDQKQHEVFFKMICLASGKNEAGQVIAMNQQIAAIYQLQNYPKYAFAAIPILELMKFEFGEKNPDPRSNFMLQALDSTAKALGKFI